MIQKRASLHERAVQTVARENITFTKPRTKPQRRTSKVKRTHWSDGVDPRIVQAVKRLQIPQVWRYVDVIGPTEVIIRNTPQR